MVRHNFIFVVSTHVSLCLTSSCAIVIILKSNPRPLWSLNSSSAMYEWRPVVGFAPVLVQAIGDGRQGLACSWRRLGRDRFFLLGELSVASLCHLGWGSLRPWAELGDRPRASCRHLFLALGMTGLQSCMNGTTFALASVYEGTDLVFQGVSCFILPWWWGVRVCVRSAGLSSCANKANNIFNVALGISAFAWTRRARCSFCGWMPISLLWLITEFGRSLVCVVNNCSVAVSRRRAPSLPRVDGWMDDE